MPERHRTPKAHRVLLRPTSVLEDPARYRAALDEAEARATPTPDVPRPIPAEPATPIERVEISVPAPQPAATATIDEGPLVRVMREIGTPTDVAAVRSAWITLIPLLSNQVAEISALERAIARMTRAEARVQPTRKVSRVQCYNNVLYGTMYILDNRVDFEAIHLLLACEQSGVLFQTHTNYRELYTGVCRRDGLEGATGRGSVGALGAAFRSLRALEQLRDQLTAHLPHLDAAQRSAVNAEVALLGIDLFAEGRGTVPLCKGLRVAVASHKRNLERKETIWLWRMFTSERVDDLIGILENRDVRTRDLERLFRRPEVVGTTAFDGLLTFLAA